MIVGGVEYKTGGPLRYLTVSNNAEEKEDHFLFDIIKRLRNI
jgi:hypothetical protein